ncbi:hypothetical protein [Actinocorallia lasiicapitis]
MKVARKTARLIQGVIMIFFVVFFVLLAVTAPLLGTDSRGSI